MTIGKISTYRSGVDLVFEWKIENFFNISKSSLDFKNSSSFSFGSEIWWLRIYPHGSSQNKSSGHVDLCLGCVSNNSIRQSFSLSLKTVTGEKYNEQYFSKDFGNFNIIHRFNRFISRSELSRRIPELVPQGVLTVVCTMKSSTSAGNAKKEVPTAEVNKSDVAGSSKSEASGSSQAAIITTKKSVLKWIEENCKESSKGQKRKTEKENVLKWIEQNFNETSGGKKRKMEEKNGNSASAKCSSDSDSAECCHCKGNFATGSLSSHQRKCIHRPIKCPDCLEVVVLQKWLNDHECQQEKPEGAQSLCEDYKKVLLGGQHHDLILKVGDKELRAHRDILRARSRVFESMLDHDMKEKNSGIIDVPDCDPNAMELFLSYIYCGKFEAQDHINMLALYYVADKYEMMELKSECCNFIKKSVSITNICSVIQLALKHIDSDLLEYATGYFSDNVLDIMQTVEWQSFLKDNSTVGNELLMKSIKKLKNAQT